MVSVRSRDVNFDEENVMTKESNLEQREWGQARPVELHRPIMLYPIDLN